MTKTFIDPGDVVLAEGPSYAGALTTFSTYQTTVLHAPMDADGLVVDELEALHRPVGRGGPPGQVPLYRAHLQQPWGNHAVPSSAAAAWWNWPPSATC